MYIAKGGNRIAGIIFGFVFFAVGMSLQNTSFVEDGKQFAYILGIVGLGLAIILICSILMQDQRKK